jgi:hypothetical protein
MNDLNKGLTDAVSEHTRSQAAKRLQVVIRTLQMTIHEIERYHAKFDEVATDTERARLMSWAVNYLVCISVPNLRIDLLADSQSELIALERE